MNQTRDEGVNEQMNKKWMNGEMRGLRFKMGNPPPVPKPSHSTSVWQKGRSRWEQHCIAMAELAVRAEVWREVCRRVAFVAALGGGGEARGPH